MPVAADRRSMWWTKQKLSKILPVVLFAAFSAVKPRSTSMDSLPCANVFTTSLQTFTHPQFEVGSAFFALLRRGGSGSAYVSPSSKEGLAGRQVTLTNKALS